MKETRKFKKMSILAVLLGTAWAWAAVPPASDPGNHAGHDHSEHAEHEGDHEGHDGETHESPGVSSAAHDRLRKEQLPAALAAVDKATTAVRFGDKKTALAELARLKKLIMELQQGLNEHGKLVFVNSRCPIMGNKIDPAKVTPALTRTYKGKKLALCCAGCVPKWDQLTEAQKDAKLKALVPVKAKHDPDDGGDHSGHVH